MKYLLDTDHLSIIEARSGAEYAFLAQRLTQLARTDVGLSIVSFQEQVLGAHKYINQAKTSLGLIQGYALMQRLIRATEILPVVPFDAAAAAILDQIIRQRLRVGTMDLRIAATAIARDLTLLTRNVSDFGKIPQLRTEDWTR